MSELLSYGASFTGPVRSENQDAIRTYAPEDELTLHNHGQLYAVADGMGGYEHGGIASTLALETFFHAFYGGNPGKPAQNLKQGIQAANLAVYQAAQRMQARMGTTLSVVNVTGNQAHIAHIGDSRVYLVRGQKSVCLTNDHTAVGELVRMKVLSPDKVRHHERRSVLEKCLGMQLFVQPDITRHILADGDYLILCSDGVWAYVEDDEFAHVAVDVRAPESISQALIELAESRESDDNLSAVVIQVQKLAALAPFTEPRIRPGFRQLIRNHLAGKS